ncbi:type IV secretion system DNA-binding domain-containing protein [Candidatus Uhrbacteria bacterium]|nr:type IV secretion system DNA-binding domain-containing protein [Candidatus Uhrbacteria bacterium]
MIPLFLLQLDVMSTDSVSSAGILQVLEDPIVLLVLVLAGLVLGVFLVLYIIHSLFVRRGRASVAFNLQVLLVRVPKETKKEDVEQSKTAQQIQELISVMETFFASVGATKSERGFMPWLLGRERIFSCEIVMAKNKISFYIVAPSKYREFVEQQIHAQFPTADVEEVPDYNIFQPNGIIMGSYLKLKRPSHFPIKTYKKIESDPLNSLTNALSKIEEGDGAAVQIVMTSAPPKWRREGLRIAKAMQQGKKLSEVNKGGVLSSVGKELISLASTAKPGEQKAPEQYRLSPLEEEMVKGLEEKSSKAGLDCNIRIIVSSKNADKARRYLNDIVGSFGQFNIYEYGNSFAAHTPTFQSGMVRHFIYRHYDPRYRLTMNTEEVSSVFHFPLPSTETPKINWLLVRRALPPPNLPTEGILLGLSEYRGHRYQIRMKGEDRRRHMYIIGGSGAGKTALMASIVRQDIMNGHGVCVIDPHGDFADECLTFVPKERADDVVYFNPSDTERPMGLNMMEYDERYPEQKTFVINEMLKIFDKLYDLKSTGGPMFEQYMRNAMILLMDHPESGSTLMEIPKVLSDEEFRAFKLTKCKTQVVKDFWIKEAQKAGGEASLQNMVPYITSKLTPFIANDIMRPIIGQQKSAFNLREIMDGSKILLLNLSKGKLGDLNAYLIGMVLVGKILMAALSRTDMEPDKRKDFYLYIDEFQNFLTDSISAILSEARKYGLDLIVAHQYIGQLAPKGDTAIRDAIFGNVGTKMVGRVGVDDAEFLAKEFAPIFSQYDLVNVEGLNYLTRLLIDNTASRPFSMKVQFAPRPGAKEKELAKMIVELSRYKYGRKRELIEAEILERQRAQESMAMGDESDDEFTL